MDTNTLDIRICPNLKGWWRSAPTPHHQQHQSLPSFPRLSSLNIFYCPNLTSMPLFPNLQEKLVLNGASVKPLQQTMAMTSSLPSSSSSPSPLSKLKDMTLWDIEDDGGSLPDGWVSNLNSLKSLVICNYPRLKSMSGAMRYLTSLEKLEISSCDEFDPFSDVGAEDDSMEWIHLNCLHTLSFSKLPKLESLPAGLQRVTTLKNLTFSDCPNLIGLPEWIGEFTSLEYLRFTGCAPNLTSLHVISCLKYLKKLEIGGFHNLTTFPEWISNFTSLEKLEIEECPNLTSLLDGICYLRFLWDLRIQDCLNLTTFPERISELTSLQRLKISKCPNLTSLADGMHGLSSLQSLEIIRCPNLTSLPDGMHGLSSLQTLRIAGCPHLEKKCEKGIVPICFPFLRIFYSLPKQTKGFKNQSFAADIHFFINNTITLCPKNASCSNLCCVFCNCHIDELDSSFACYNGIKHLANADYPKNFLWKYILVTGCISWILLGFRKLMQVSRVANKGMQHTFWSYVGVHDGGSLPDEWASNLSSLKSLVIIKYPRLTSMSRAMRNLTSLEKLDISGCDEFGSLSDVGALDDGMEWRHLKCLHTLCFSKLPKLESLPAGLQRVTTLKNLTFSDCTNLICLPEWISEFTSLEYLVFTRCAPSLTSLPDVIGCLKSLKILEIEGFHNLTTFPERIGELTSLQRLEISKCPNLTSLPDGMHCLGSLQSLEIIRCPKITSLPDGMHGLRSLQWLRIAGCPHLEKKCEEGIGEDWPKIAHVPYYSNYLHPLE
uniref:Disease resistance R13L4/SHOC-2-like LRR domain-containing protein n=1 Tax=Fagus sylvatica TaxID=28930 RepID=A0A2N9GSQ0_FAGSY